MKHSTGLEIKELKDKINISSENEMALKVSTKIVYCPYYLILAIKLYCNTYYQSIGS